MQDIGNKTRKSTSKSLVTYSQSTGIKSSYCPLFIISHIISTAIEDLSLLSDSKGRSSNHTTCKQSLSVRQKKVKPRINCVYLYKWNNIYLSTGKNTGDFLKIKMLNLFCLKWPSPIVPSFLKVLKIWATEDSDDCSHLEITQ